MAWTERYVTAAGAGAHDGTSEANAWTLAEAQANAVAGHRVNIKNDAYSLTTDLTFADGTDNHTFIILRGYNSTIGDLDTPSFDSEGKLETTNMPGISNGTYKFALGDYNMACNLNFTSANVSFGEGGLGSNQDSGTVIFNCKVSNSGSNGNANVIEGDNECTVAFCDLICTGATSGQMITGDTGLTVIGTRLQNDSSTSADSAIFANGGYLVVSHCAMAGYGNGVEINSLASAFMLVTNSSFAVEGDAVKLPNSVGTTTAPILLSHNVAFGFSAWINNAYSGTDNAGVVELFNALPSSPTRTGTGDSHVVGEVTLSSSPFTDSANDDLTLNSTDSAGILCQDAGIRQNMDLGSLPVAGGGVRRIRQNYLGL